MNTDAVSLAVLIRLSTCISGICVVLGTYYQGI